MHNNTTILPSIDEIKHQAKKLKQTQTEIKSHNGALDIIANKYGYATWKKMKPAIEEQEKNIFFVLGMTLFNSTVKEIPSIGANRDTVVEQIGQIARNHLGIIERYGSSDALTSIFLGEVAKYYINALYFPYEDTVNALREQSYRLAAKDGLSRPVDCIVTYPSFTYKRREDGVSLHIPVFRGYMLNGDIARLLEIKYERHDSDSGITMESAGDIIFELAELGLDEWTEDHEIYANERELMLVRILEILTTEHRGACKKEVIEDAIEKGAGEALRRIMTTELPFGTCTGGTGILEQLTAKYVVDDEVEKFKKEFMHSFNKVDEQKSPYYLEKFLLSYNDKEKTERRKAGKSDGNGADMMLWSGRSALDMSKIKHHSELKKYVDMIKDREEYFSADVQTLIRCDVKKGKASFEISDVMAMFQREPGDYENISFQTSKMVCTKEEFSNCLQAHWDYCLVNDLLPRVLIDKVILTTEDRWFKNYNE